MTPPPWAVTGPQPRHALAKGRVGALLNALGGEEI